MDCLEWVAELEIRRTWVIEDAYLAGEITFEEMMRLEAEETVDGQSQPLE